ncbi:MAG: DoxX family protein [Saprospiraceae bacterium]|jgi:uncharacterized membrane protein YphA (DoxX/SURF4 family)|nr:DoxX family protein [Saprospiraceae bacterium]MBK9994635.1 DoxX family protein [Saprospiraceae bacterium]
MNTAIWIAQGILAVMFAMAGVMKSTQPIDKLVKSGLNWVERVPVSTVRFIGLSELLGAVGLILPWVFGILPILTPIAAIGLAVIMVLAAVHHLKHKESKAVVFNTVLFLLAIFVAYGRFKSL